MGFKGGGGGSGQIDGSNATFKSAARSALAEPIVVTSPISGATGVTRLPSVLVEEPQGAVWMHADLLADQIGVGINTDLIASQVHTQSNSGLSLNTTTGVFTLPAGHVFMLDCTLHAQNFSVANGDAGYEWVYDDNSEIVGAARAILRPVTGTGQHGAQPRAWVSMRTQEVTKVKLRCVAASGTHDLADIGTNISITEISSHDIAAHIEVVEAIWSSNGSTVSSGDVAKGYNLLRNSKLDGGPNAASWIHVNFPATLPDNPDISQTWVMNPTNDALIAELYQDIPGLVPGDAHTIEFYGTYTGPTIADFVHLELGDVAWASHAGAHVSYDSVTGLFTGGAVASVGSAVLVSSSVQSLSATTYRIIITVSGISATTIRALIHVDANTFPAAQKVTYNDARMQRGNTIVGKYDTGNVAVTLPRVPNVVWGFFDLGNLANETVSVRGKDTTGAYSTPAKSVAFTTELRSTINLAASIDGVPTRIVRVERENTGTRPRDLSVSGHTEVMPPTDGSSLGALQVVDWASGAELPVGVGKTTFDGNGTSHADISIYDKVVENVVVKSGSHTNLVARLSDPVDGQLLLNRPHVLTTSTRIFTMPLAPVNGDKVDILLNTFFNPGDCYLDTGVDGRTFGGTALQRYLFVNQPSTPDVFGMHSFIYNSSTNVWDLVRSDGPAALTHFRAWTPADLAARAIDLDFTALTGADGVVIPSITNLGSLGGAYANASAAQQPTLQTLTGRRVARFDGADDWFEGSAIHNLGSQFGLFAIVRMNEASGANLTSIITEAHGGQTSYGLEVSGGLKAAFFNSTWRESHAGTVFASGDAMTVIGNYDQANLKTRKDGVEIGSLAYTGAAPAAAQLTRIGRRWDGTVVAGDLLAFDAYRIIGKAGAWTADEITRLEGYGMWLTGRQALLPADHAHRYLPPMSAS